MSKSNSNNQTKPKVLFVLTGSIACFKACQTISKLVQSSFEVKTVATPSALRFIGAATLEGLTGSPVHTDTFENGHMMSHIHLARWADLIIVAPASANFINKAAGGIGDDLASTLFLAHDFKKPFLIAPAMNTSMYQHPVTNKSIQALAEMGIQVLETASGVLACGEMGWGRLLEPELIFNEIEKALNLSSKKSLNQAKPKILVTSGGTQEPIDQVRVLTNKSTGSTGAAIADELTEMGFEVTYLHSESSALPSSSVQLRSFTSFETLQNQLINVLGGGTYQAVVHAAAVSDFKVENPFSNKMSSDQDLTLHLKRNPKLVDQLRDFAKNPNLKVIAFKMTANADEQKQMAAINKLFQNAMPDLVVHNDTSEIQPTLKKHTFRAHNRSGDVVAISNKPELGKFIGQYLMQAQKESSL